jgi:nucleoid-associated protein YgaU
VAAPFRQEHATMSTPDKPDFSNVQSGFTTTEEVIGGSGGGGGTGEQTYTIEKGDTLSAIAKRFYGKSKYWHQVYEANRDTIEDPDRIFPGQTIKLPAIDIDGDGDLDDPTLG